MVIESWLSFMSGNILFIPTAANEKASKASWMIILGVQNDGIGVPFSTGSIWNMGSSTMGTPFGVVLEVVMPALSFSCIFSPALYFHVLFPLRSLVVPYSPQVSLCAA